LRKSRAFLHKHPALSLLYSIGLFCGHSELFCRNVELFCNYLSSPSLMVSFADILSSLVELNKTLNVGRFCRCKSSQQPDLEGSLVIGATPYNTELEIVFSSSTCLFCGDRELYCGNIGLFCKSNAIFLGSLLMVATPYGSF